MIARRKTSVCDKIFRVGEDTTPEFSKVRDQRGYGCVTSGKREDSEEYRKFLSRARKARG